MTIQLTFKHNANTMDSNQYDTKNNLIFINV